MKQPTVWRAMSKKAALSMPRAGAGTLWRELATGIVWRITGRNKEGYCIARVSGGKKSHTMYHQNLYMFYEKVQ